MKVVIHGLGLRSGGGKASLLHLLPAMARQGRHQYAALIPELPEYAALQGPNLRLLPKRSAEWTNLILREWWLNVTVWKVCREEGADALLCLGNFVPHQLPVPTVVFLQNAYFVYCDKFARRGLTLRERMILKYGSYQFRHLPENVTVVVQTDVMRARLLSQFPIPESRVYVVPDCVEDLRPIRGSCVKYRDDTFNGFTFLCVATFSPNKNLQVLVDAVKRLRTLSARPFRCLLTIDPDQHPGASRLLSNIEREGVGNMLENIGPQPTDQLAAVYASADAFILPTLLESFGRPYPEAMQFGLPILTSDRDFAHERCQDAAVYFDPLDADSVARAMAAIMEDGNLRSRLAENGKRVLEELPTLDEVAAAFVTVLERTTGQRHERAIR